MLLTAAAETLPTSADDIIGQDLHLLNILQLPFVFILLAGTFLPLHSYPYTSL